MRAGVHPAIEPRLVRAGLHQREGVSAYIEAGGYRSDGLEGGPLLAAVRASGLRGRGGAAFPAGVKWAAVAEAPAPRFLVANGAEAEPACWKDRYLLRYRPHLVLEGVGRAAGAVGAASAWVYVCDPQSADSVRAALGERPPLDVPVEVIEVPPAYVAGEETAAVRAIGGGPAKPTTKPPRPFQAGVAGRPTVVTNVETLANVPLIATSGPDVFRRVGTAESPGTFLFSASGACRSPGVYELPLGISVRAAFAVAGGFAEDPVAFLMGGYFSGLLNSRALDLPMEVDRLRAASSGLGCGAVVAIGSGECPVAVAASVMGFFARESSGQCGVCVKGTAAMRDAVASLASGKGGPAAMEGLGRWSTGLRGRGACALLDGAAMLAGSLLREFPDLVARHLVMGCALCRRWRHREWVPASALAG